MRLSYYLKSDRLSSVDLRLGYMYICVTSVMLSCFPGHNDRERPGNMHSRSTESLDNTVKRSGINKGYSKSLASDTSQVINVYYTLNYAWYREINE